MVAAETERLADRFAVLAVGHDTEIQILMAFMATLILATHLTLGSLLAIGDLVTIGPKEKEPAQ